MLPEIVPSKWRRLWRRRLRQRPLLPFLLLATLTVDLLLAVGVDFDRDSYATFVGYGFLLAQIGLLAAWSLHTTRWIAQRLLLALGASVAIGWWFFANGRDDLPWFSTFVLAVNVVVVAVWHRFRRKKSLTPRRRRYGIGGLLAWTTLVAIAIASLRSIDWAQTTAVLLAGHEVWTGAIIDALILALTLTVASWGWSLAATSFIVVAGSALLVMSRLALMPIVWMGIIHYMSPEWVGLTSGHVKTLVTYQAALVATLLLWVLGIRYLPNGTIHRTEPKALAAALIEPPVKIDLTA